MNIKDERPWETFPAETLRRLFDAVEVDDIVDAHVALPQPIDLSCPPERIRQCYALCLQWWEEGVNRRELLALVNKVLRHEGLSADERMTYKYMRARYKHLRFAQRLYSRDHTSDFLLDLTTRVLGHLQDGFRSGRRSAIRMPGLKLRLLLSAPVFALVRRRMETVSLDGEAGLIAFQKSEMQRLKKAMHAATFAGDEFHMVRKIVSMQVSFYDTVRSLGPDEHAFRMSRFLAAINGLMGSRHDEMVAESLAGRRHYDTPAPLDKETRQRIETLISRYPD